MMQPPQLLDAATDALTVAWHEDTHGQTIYEIQMAQQNGAELDWQTLSNKLQSNVVRKRNLKPGTEYRFRVRAAPDDHFSDPSEPIRTLDEGVQRIAEPPTCTASSHESITVAWQPVDGAAAYELQMAEAVDAPLQWSTVSAKLQGTSAKKKGALTSETF